MYLTPQSNQDSKAPKTKVREKVRFISLKWKLVFIICFILTITNGAIALITYYNLDTQFESQQNEILEYISRENEKQINLIYRRLQDFSDITPLLSNKSNDLQSTANSLNAGWENLQLTFNIKSAKLIAPNNILVKNWGPNLDFSTDDIFEKVSKQQQPISTLFCQTNCLFVLATPVLTEEGKTAVLVLTHPISDWLVNLKIASGSDVGVLTVDAHHGSWLENESTHSIENWHASIIGLTNTSKNINIIQKLSQNVLLKNAQSQNNYISRSSEYLNVQFLPLKTGVNSKEATLILIHDITPHREQIRLAVLGAILMAILGVIFASIAIISSMLKPVNNLSTLSKILPKLAEGQFESVRNKLSKLNSIKNTRDEVDSLADSARLLIQQLETLEAKVSRREEELSRNALYDELTGLANRRLFMDRIASALKLQRRDNKPFAVLFLDLDQFKKVNDTLGHEHGDLLLKKVAKLLSSCVRQSDTVARLGGDEFIILLSQLDDGYNATSVAIKLLERMRSPIEVKDRSHIVTTSIGIAVAPENGDDPETLLRNADLAMYKAKGMGRDNYHYFTASMNIEAQEQLALENELRVAVEREEFILHYQPQIDLSTGSVVGAEALLRWESPTRGFVSPFVFMDALEDTGLIVPLGEKILRMACQKAKAWNEMDIPELKVAVNLSARQFNDPNLVECIQSILQEEELDSRYLELEITESMLMNDINETIETLHRLKGLGLTLSIDDFGTGYSSLSYLKQFPVNTLKVDRAFVKDIPENKSDMAISSAVIAMAHKLNLSVVAEGIEQDVQADFLKQNQCEVGQGYLFGKPMPTEQLKEFLISKYNLAQ